MLEYLLGLDKVSLSNGFFSFAVRLPAELIILILIVIGFISWFSYRKNKEGVSKFGWITLIVFRALLLTLLFFALLGPRWSSPTTLTEKSTVAVLVDNSKSMLRKDANHTDKQLAEIAYATGITNEYKEGLTEEEQQKVLSLTRAEIVKKALENPVSGFKRTLDENYMVKYYSFSKGLFKENDEETDKDATGAGNAIREVISDLTGKNLSGVVLFTDGGNNYGQNPVYTAKYASGQGIPIYTVGIGGTLPAKDISIEPVDFKDTLIKGDYLSIQTKISSSGYDNEVVDVVLMQAGEEVARKQVTLSLDNPRQNVEFSKKLDKAGDFSFDIHVPVHQEEAIAENNARNFTIKVVEDKIKVLLVSGNASWEYRYLKHALMRDPTMESCVLLQRVDGWFQEGNHPITAFPTNFQEMSKFDVVILIDVMVEGYLTSEQIDLLEKFVSSTGGGMVYVAGEVNGMQHLSGTAMEQMLPVSIAPVPDNSNGNPISFRPRKTIEGSKHPVLRFLSDEEENENLWGNLPGFFWYYPISELKPSAEIILEHPSQKLHGKAAPLVVQSYYGSGRVYFSSLDSTWRWRRELDDRFFYKYWGQLIRFLAQEKLIGGKRLWVSTDLQEYRRGATVNILGRALDNEMNPAALPELPCEVIQPDGTSREVLLRKRNERDRNFRSEFNPAMQGTHRVICKWDNMAAEKTFEVRYISPEQTTLTQNEELLRQIAAESGGAVRGQYVSISELSSILEFLKERQTESVENKHQSLLDTPLILLLFVFFLLMEWVLRRVYRLM